MPLCQQPLRQQSRNLRTPARSQAVLWEPSKGRMSSLREGRAADWAHVRLSEVQLALRARMRNSIPPAEAVAAPGASQVSQNQHHRHQARKEQSQQHPLRDQSAVRLGQPTRAPDGNHEHENANHGDSQPELQLSEVVFDSHGPQSYRVGYGCGMSRGALQSARQCLGVIGGSRTGKTSQSRIGASGIPRRTLSRAVRSAEKARQYSQL